MGEALEAGNDGSFRVRRIDHEAQRIVEEGDLERLKSMSLAEIYAESEVTGQAVLKIMADSVGIPWHPEGTYLPKASNPESDTPQRTSFPKRFMWVFNQMVDIFLRKHEDTPDFYVGSAQTVKMERDYGDQPPSAS